MKVSKWTEKPIDPADLINCAKSTTWGKRPFVCRFRDHNTLLYREWVGAETYLEWAESALSDEKTPEGFDTALTYAKRAVCRRIDGFVAYNHLTKFERESYPQKVEILERVGITIPSVVHDLAIDPRNESEHDYQAVDERTAKHAVGTAKIFLGHTKEDAKRSAVIALNWNLKARSGFAEHPPVSTSEDFADCFMLLVDIFEEPHKVKFVRPVDSEIEYAELHDFDKANAIELAKLLRAHYEVDDNECGWDAFSYLRFLTEARICYQQHPATANVSQDSLPYVLKSLVTQK